ncbi:MAG TPA: FliG C-terminal domain-containing protein [Armatimonadota bacterium]|jgi:flagellar motor switch protein FliG
MASPMSEKSLYQAAIVIASLEEEVAAEVCRHLDRELVQRIAMQIASLGPTPQRERQSLVQGFLETCQDGKELGGRRFAQHLLNRVLGAPELDEELVLESTGQLGALRTVADREPHVLWRACEHETPQVVAAVLSQLPPGNAAKLLHMMPEEVRTEVAYRASNLGPTSPGAMEAVVRSLTESARCPTAEGQGQHDTGLEFLLSLLQNVDRATEKSLLEGLKSLDGEFATSVEERLVTFEDLFNLDDRSVQTLLRAVPIQTLALALRGADEKIKRRAQSNLSSRIQEELTQEMELMGPVRVSQVEQAQREVTNLAREMADRGEFDLHQEHNEYI